MKQKTAAHDVVHAVLAAEYHRFEGSVEIVHEKHSGKDAAFAVAFEERNGRQRRGLIGLCPHGDGMWQPSGSFMGAAHVTGSREVFMSCGGWGSGGDGSKERAVFGGWVADPSAVSARLVDSTRGDVLEETVVNGVVIFMQKGDLPLRYARVELLDSAQRVVRAGPALRTART